MIGTESRAQITSSFQLVKEESVSVHTDKPSYLAGEIVWFKAFLKTETDTFTTNFNSSRILYVELLNNTGNVVAQAKTDLTNGSGDGSFYLPLNLSTGVYTLTAYSTKLKNAGSGYFFYKKITVINTIRNSSPTDSLSNGATTVNFFPESGTILYNVPAKMGVQVTETGTNKPLENVSGYIIENKKDTVASFLTGRLGLGQFTFTPKTGRQYESIIKYPGTGSIAQALPAVKNEGYHLSVTEDAGKYRIHITSTHIAAGKASLLVKSASGLKISGSFGIHSGQQSIDIEKSGLENGLSYLILTDNNNQTVAERLLFKPGNNITQRLQLITDKTVYSPRERINISIAGNNTSAIIKGSVSVSYSPATGVAPYEDLASFLNNSSYSATEIENLLLVYGPGNFNMNPDAGNLVPEYDGHIVTARVTSSWNGEPAPGVRCALSIPSAIPFG
ncbi:MAG TPA: MG2 domain-containing protein, partial [Niabella sp.]|nr:MG2 domain-containing protein [Niabella sp.]